MPPLFFLKWLMSALWQVPHIPLPVVAHVLNLTASCPWLANSDSFCVLHKYHFWDAELAECFVSCYSCLSPSLFICFLILWTHFAFWLLPVVLLLWSCLFSYSSLSGNWICCTDLPCQFRRQLCFPHWKKGFSIVPLTYISHTTQMLAWVAPVKD